MSIFVYQLFNSFRKAFAWIFFEDVDFVRDPEGNVAQGFIMARKPRRKLSPGIFAKTPKILRDIAEKEQ